MGSPPGKSNHGFGNAGDLKYANAAAKQWWHQNAAAHGLAFPLGNEDWHIELASARGGRPHQHAQQVAAAPRVRPAAEQPTGPVSFGDVVAPPTAPVLVQGPDLGALLASRLPSIQGRRGAGGSEKQRRSALFDGDALAALYAQ
jgi:hypothetical protein